MNNVIFCVYVCVSVCFSMCIRQRERESVCACERREGKEVGESIEDRIKCFVWSVERNYLPS